MAHTEPPNVAESSPPSPAAVQAGHEPNTVSSRAVVRFVLGLASILIVVHFLIWGVFQLLKQDAKSEDRPLPPGVSKQFARLPPAPRLEDRPLAPRAQLNARENRILGTYGWVDKKAGTVRIPIERAMDLITNRGLPATATAPAASPATGAAAPEKPLPPRSGR
jgi:hypothetical protein